MEFFEAVKRIDIAEVKKLLTKGQSSTEFIDRFVSNLSSIVFVMKLMKIFLVYLKNCPLHCAARSDKFNTILKILLWQDDIVDNESAKEFFKRTALHCASWTKAQMNLTTLLCHGSSLNAKDRGNKTPMQLAKRHGKNFTVLREWMRMRKLDFLFEKIFILFFILFFLVGNIVSWR